MVATPHFEKVRRDKGIGVGKGVGVRKGRCEKRYERRSHRKVCWGMGEVRGDGGKGEGSEEMWGSVLGPHTHPIPLPLRLSSPHIPTPHAKTLPHSPHTLSHTLFQDTSHSLALKYSSFLFRFFSFAFYNLNFWFKISKICPKILHFSSISHSKRKHWSTHHCLLT